MIPPVFHSGKRRIMETVERSVVDSGLRSGRIKRKKKAQTNFRAVKLFCVILGD